MANEEFDSIKFKNTTKKANKHLNLLLIPFFVGAIIGWGFAVYDIINDIGVFGLSGDNVKDPMDYYGTYIHQDTNYIMTVIVKSDKTFTIYTAGVQYDYDGVHYYEYHSAAYINYHYDKDNSDTYGTSNGLVVASGLNSSDYSSAFIFRITSTGLYDGTNYRDYKKA